MADVLTRMVGPKQLENSTTTQYTSPSSGAVIREIIVSNPTTSDVGVTFGIGTDAAGTRIADGFPIPAKSIWVLDCNIVLGNAELFKAHCATSSTLVMTVSGIET